MPLARSRLTVQCQISVPAEIRRRLGVGPGSAIEWDERGAQVVVRRAGRHSSREVHAALFGADAPPPPPADTKAGIRKRMRAKHARG